MNFLWSLSKEILASYQASNSQKTAERLIAAGRDDEALLNLRQALYKVPDHLQACRSMAHLLDRRNDAKALDYYRFIVLEGSILPGEIQLGDASSYSSSFFDGGGDVLRSGDQFLSSEDKIALSKKATRQDAKDFALAALKYGRINVAWDVANLVSLKWRDEAFPHLIRARINGGAGDVVAQEQELRSALHKSQGFEVLSDLHDFFIANPEPRPSRSAELFQVLERICSLEPDQKTLALCTKSLASGVFESDDLQRVLELIRKHPAATASTLFFTDQFELASQPASRSRILERIVTRTRSLPIQERIPVVNWLLDIGEPEQALQVLPLADAFSNTPAFAMWVEIAIALKQWKQLDKALMDPSNPLPEYRTRAIQATISSILGDSAKSQKIWNQVLSKNRSQPQVFLDLLVTLIRAGEWQMVYREMPSLLDDPAWGLKAVDALEPVARQHRDSRIMLDFYHQTMRTRFLSTETTTTDRAAYTRLVLGETLPLEDLEFRAKKTPENIALRITYAFGLLRSGSKVKALFELKDVEPRVVLENLLPHQKGVYAKVVAANGNIEEAQAILKTITPESLTRQEEAFFFPPATAKKAN
ncbi:MAG: hypothetical protein WCG66_10995 [bacterium]